MSAQPSTPEQGPVVVGYDGTEQSDAALEQAFVEAPKRGTDVVVVVVAGIPYETGDPYQLGSIGVGVIPPIPAEGPPEIQGVMAEARKRLEASGVPGEVEWSLGDPVTEILRVARERNASAIVVGAHHHSALGRLLGADTAAEIAKSAKCDVLIAR